MAKIDTSYSGLRINIHQFPEGLTIKRKPDDLVAMENPADQLLIVSDNPKLAVNKVGLGFLSPHLRGSLRVSSKLTI